MKNPWILIGVIAVLLIGTAVWYSGTVNERYNNGVVVEDHIKGNPDAAVKLVEYSDFQCPACAQFHPYIIEIMDAYGDQLSFEYRHFPLTQIHPFAEPAARAAEAAGQQGKFFEYHDLLFTNQTTWSASGNPSQYFLQYAEELGLDIEQFTRQQRSSLLSERIRSQFSEARNLGFTGTPSFTLNGEKMVFSSYADFKSQIEQAINPTVQINTDMSTTDTAGNETGTSSTIEATVDTNAPTVRFGL